MPHGPSEAITSDMHCDTAAGSVQLFYSVMMRTIYHSSCHPLSIFCSVSIHTSIFLNPVSTNNRRYATRTRRSESHSTAAVLFRLRIARLRKQGPACQGSRGPKCPSTISRRFTSGFYQEDVSPRCCSRAL